MARARVPEAEALLDQPYPVLDHGFVRLVDYLGSDDRVVEAARVSYGGGTRTLRENQSLIHYLMRNDHTSPFEQVVLVVHMKLPLFVFAQMVRHRTARLNSLSARYSVMEDEFYLPQGDQLRAQSTLNKQVGDGELPQEVGEQGAATLRQQASDAYAAYERLLAQGVSREQARMLLPQNLYTQIYWQCDLHNLFHFLRLRLDWHAQAEIRAYAEVLAMMASKVAPLCYGAFEEHILGGTRLSRTEVDAINAMLSKESVQLSEKALAELKRKMRWSTVTDPSTAS